MAHVLTPGERQLVGDHLRGGLRTCGRYAALEVVCLAGGMAVGHVVGTVIGYVGFALGARRGRYAVPGPSSRARQRGERA